VHGLQRQAFRAAEVDPGSEDLATFSRSNRDGLAAIPLRLCDAFQAVHGDQRAVVHLEELSHRKVALPGLRHPETH